MKKIIKNICLFSIMLCLSLMFISNAKAEKFRCNEYPLDWCPSPGIDAYNNACSTEYSGSSLQCVINNNAKTCPEIYAAEGSCPQNDDFGNKCGTQYSGSSITCVISEKAQYEELKTCGEYGKDSCPSKDYKGNVCAKDSSGYCYVSQNNQSCESITSKGICDGRKNDCLWETNSSGIHQCFSLIKPNQFSPTCDTITDKLTCKLRTDCKLITNSKGYLECAGLITPGSDSVSCDQITNMNTCELRTDCEPYTNSKGNRVCGGIIIPDSSSTTCNKITDMSICTLRADCEPGYNSAGLRVCEKKVGYEGEYGGEINGVVVEKAPFKCSDVKYLTSAWLFIRIAAPFIVVLFGSLDFFKSMIAGDEKKMRESRGKFIKRLIAFGLLILLPFIVQFVFQIMGTYGSDNVCLVKCIATNDTSEKGCD